MRLSTDPGVLIDHAERSFDAAVEETVERVRADAPVLTGDYRAKFSARTGQTAGGSLTARIGNSHPGTRAIELGADVGPRRGPHMKAAGSLRRTGDDYLDNMDDALVRIR